MVSTRSGHVCVFYSGSKRSAPDDAEAASVTEECPICLSEMKDPNATVFLACGHRFHGQCAATALQGDPRCPICRFSSASPPTYSSDDFIEQAEEVVISRLVKRARPESMRTMLADFDVKEQYTKNARRQQLAEMLSEQLHYETDDEAEEDGDF